MRETHKKTIEDTLRVKRSSVARSSRILYSTKHARVVELVDTHALGACAARRGGSSPLSRTNKKSQLIVEIFCWLMQCVDG
jgi:hypothetical protein